MIHSFIKFILCSKILLKNNNCIDSSYYNKSERCFTQLDGYFEIKNCFFMRFSTFQGSGGILYLYITTKSSILRIILSTFFSCFSTVEGGAFYYISTANGRSYLSKICASNCTGIRGSHFGLAQVTNSFTHYNRAEYISIHKSSSTFIFEYSFRLIYGNQVATNINFSNNYAIRTTGPSWELSFQFRSFYCTLSNNTCDPTGYICMRLQQLNSFTSLEYYCIIRNNSPNYGVVYVYGGPNIISNSFFSKNFNTHRLFALEPGSILNVKNSLINHHGSYLYTSSTVSYENVKIFTLNF